MRITAIDELNSAVSAFYEAAHRDETARFSAETCVITFGGKAELMADFCIADRQKDTEAMTARGGALMAEAVNMALDCLEAREPQYRCWGNDPDQPRLILMANGNSDGSGQAKLERAIARVQDLIIAE